MKAITLDPQSFQLTVSEANKPDIPELNTLIELKAAALNHHELWVLQEKNLSTKEAVIMGSDGAGVISSVGSLVKGHKPGDEVLINPSIHWGNDPKVQGADYEILGFPTQGTFAQQISIPASYVCKKPSHLSMVEAASLPLAGLTAYRALFTRGQFEQNNRVLITGIGGGVALFAMQFALALGAKVFVTSGDDKKITKAIELGASGGENYRNEGWAEALKIKAKGFDVIIDSSAGAGFKYLVELANPGARIALYGRTTGKISDLDPKLIFWKQLSIHGTTMGTTTEFNKMLDFVEEHQIHPIVDAVFAPANITDAFAKMSEGQQFGKIALDMSTF